MKGRQTVLVTGSGGQLGSALLLESRKSKGIDWFFCDSEQLDITDLNQVRDIFAEKEYDFCINCAAYTNVEKSESEPDKAIAVNLVGVKNIVDTLKNKHTTLIHISTDYVFDGSKADAYHELDRPNPINEYGKSKLKGERYITKHLENYYIIRTSWLYSAFSSNFYTFIKSKLANNTKIEVISSQNGSPTSAIDLSRALIHIMQTDQKNHGIFHFSNSGLTNWYIFAKEIIGLIDPNKMNQLVEIEEFKTKAKRPANSKLDSSKFERTFGYTIPYWKDALRSVIKGQ